MSFVRTTQSLMVNRVLANLSRQMSNIMRLQDRLATGQRVNAPSDDALATRRAINTRTAISKYEQYVANVEAVGPRLTESTSSIETVLHSLQRAQELALQGANGTYDQSQLDGIAMEVNQLLEGVVVEANHVTNGQHVFGGTATLDAPFEVTRDANGEITAVTYVGNDEHTEIPVSDAASVIVNVTGEEAFLTGQDVFQLLINLRDNLRAGDQTSVAEDRLTELQEAVDQSLISLARIGAVQNRLTNVTTNADDAVTRLQEFLSDTIDADYADTIIRLNAQSNAFQAALNAGARVIQPSLLDFLQ